MNGRDVEARAQLVALFGVVDAKRDDDENEADQRAARAARKHVEIIPVVHSPSPRLRRFPVHYNAVLGERAEFASCEHRISES